jgi:hypothetical protein
MRYQYIVKSKVRALVSKEGKRISRESLVALDKRVESLIMSAIKNAGKNTTIVPTEVELAKSNGNGNGHDKKK